MRVRLTATIAVEVFDVELEDYPGTKTEEDILACERKLFADAPYESGLVELLLSDGDLSDIKIEKMEEAKAA